MIRTVAEGYSDWQANVRTIVASWPPEGVPESEAPRYAFGSLEVSADRTMISVRLEGDPRSRAAQMLFEGAVPTDLFRKLPSDTLNSLELSYDRSGIRAPVQWLPASLSR
jgi:hypothetical protein